MQGVYCGLSTASEMFLIFTTQLYQYFSVFFLFAPFSDEPEVFLPKYFETAILHAAHFLRVVNIYSYNTAQAVSTMLDFGVTIPGLYFQGNGV